MYRHQEQYQHRKLAWELSQSPQWKDFLLPLLERAVNQPVPEIVDTPSSYEAAKVQQEQRFAKNLISKVNNQTNKFLNTKVDGAEAPIVVPE